MLIPADIQANTIEGTATISIAQLDFFRQQAKEVEKMKQEQEETREALKKLVVGLDDAEYKRQLEIIDSTKNLSDRKIREMCNEATATLRVFISVPELRKLVRKYIDKDASEGHYDISVMKKAEFDAIPLILKGQQEAVQPDINICRICEEYIENERCEKAEDGSCQIAVIANQLMEAREKIKQRDLELAKLREQLADAKIQMSYMVNPQEIGDRCEMGG